MAAALSTTVLEAWVRDFARLVGEHREELTALDSAIGDGDHGTNMDRGMRAVVTALDGTPPTSPAALFKTVAMTLISTVGGASGPLFGTLFLRMATALGDAEEVTAADLAGAFSAGLDGVVARGKAQTGDKTMLDALTPAVEALRTAATNGTEPADALRRAAEAAQAGRDATIPMEAHKGRASYLGERSVGHQDPGATTVALLLNALADAAA